jgi:hypothetical protein
VLCVRSVTTRLAEPTRAASVGHHGRALLSSPATSKSPQSSATKNRAISKQITVSANELQQVQKALAMCNAHVRSLPPARPPKF